MPPQLPTRLRRRVRVVALAGRAVGRGTPGRGWSRGRLPEPAAHRARNGESGPGAEPPPASGVRGQAARDWFQDSDWSRPVRQPGPELLPAPASLGGGTLPRSLLGGRRLIADQTSRHTLRGMVRPFEREDNTATEKERLVTNPPSAGRVGPCAGRRRSALNVRRGRLTGRRDVLVHAEEVRRVVCALQL